MPQLLSYQKSPITQLSDPVLAAAEVKVYVKCEYLNHPFISGNKWWKLKYNLEEAIRLGHHTLLTFGGAYSNHLYATAAAVKELGLKSIGVVRGELKEPLNPTLAFVHDCGMKLHPITREEYRLKAEESLIRSLRNQFGDFYLIPEGGTNELAVKGVEEFGTTLLEEMDFDCLCLPVGTGGTMAGLVRAFGGKKKIIGFSALKGGNFLIDEVKRWAGESHGDWSVEENYHFGGYAKTTREVMTFIEGFESQYAIPLDHVYTGKLMFGVFDLIRKGHFKKGTTLLVLHTGGLQGSRK